MRDMPSEPKPPYVIEWHALLAYLLIGVAVIMGLSLGITQLAERFGFTELVDTGRRRDLGFVMAMLLGLPITHVIARALGLTPKRAKSP